MANSSQPDLRIPALLYHHVGVPAKGAWPQLTISPSTFVRQMRWLKLLRFTPVTPTQLLDWRLGGRRLPGKPVMLTFDDAYEDLTTYAFPVLEQLGFAAAVFVVSGHIGGTNEWDVAAGRPRRKLMNSEQMRTWSHQGIEFGAHGRTHADLCHCSDSQLEDEIAGSRGDLEQVLGNQVVAFAYPFGAHDERVRTQVSRSFSAAFTCDMGLNDSRTDLLALRRMIVGPDRPSLDHLFRLYRGRNAPRVAEGIRERLRAFDRR